MKKFALVLMAYCLSQVYWLAAMGQHVRASVSVSGEVATIPACCAMVEDIPMQIVRAVISHGISPSRALARAWNESRYQDVDSACCRSVFQLHRKYFPRMPLGQHIYIATAHLAGLIAKHGARAERVYRVGH